jgi:hypothetical protein
MICYRNNLIYLHIPKTAGTSIEKIFFPDYVFDESPNYEIANGWDETYGWLNHLTYSELKTLLPNLNTSQYSIFATVRNPWDKLVSEFFWKTSTSRLNISFTQFVSYLYNKKYKHIQSFYKSPIAFLQHIKNQSSYLPEDNSINLKIIKFENLKKELSSFFINQNLPLISIPKLRTSNHLNYKEYYNQDTINMVREIYQEDIKRFKYDFHDYNN